MQSFKDCVFCFRPASLPAHPPLMLVYHVGIGCSLSAAKVVPGFYGQKKVGAVSRLDDNLHTSISLQVVFSP